MRDFLSYDPKDYDPSRFEASAFDPDPVQRARNAFRTELPKRFYKDATAEPAEEGHRILLDGRPVRTPARKVLAVPRPDLAALIAAEWGAQGERIDPATMPHTRLANAVVDGVVERREEVAADALKYAGTDLVSYRASTPERLVDRQTELWDPVLDWVEEAYGARFLVAEGIIHVAQDPEALAAVGRAVQGLDPWRLAGLHSMTTITGSLLIALAHLQGRLGREEAWTAAQIDEDWNMALWGRDPEAVARLEARRRDFEAASAFARETGPG
ncbi:ATP12 family chaperone protein [Prosthecomicrobium sp. N25]|uniref:ATP12 family chaperone protein n=1 Tax=Prosthecomicrobium sp. N25 TaxID=3129254 RepID=UPI003078405C